MDRGERRRRDENYVEWMRLQYSYYWPSPSWLKERKLGLKKGKLWQCSHCSKKTPGRPKLARGTCGMGMDRSPKRGRGRWRLDLNLLC
jgi:hypothetical protein